ncbi:glycosyltransferase involved in cell wall biosynthesis [Pedobacter sp. UYP30]|uniref:glycosyltransferase family 4 protein n=1 Tax=Pedobacter sp. UYP30 TaxID=1756400 RepID=UPI003397A540
MQRELDQPFKKLKIAITADPQIPVPPTYYGGIERIIEMLVEGLVKQGHQVSLFAHKESVTKALFYPYPSKTNDTVGTLKNMIFVNKVLLTNQFDIIHSFSRLAYLLPALFSKTPKIMSYQREPTIGQIKKAHKLARKNTLFFTGCSKYISDKISPFAKSYTVYNGTDPAKYSFTQQFDNAKPLIFLGRIEPIKGVHLAIEIANRTNKDLIICGNISQEHQSYFDEKIYPYLSEKIRYVGPVDDEQKKRLLSNSCALLMPIIWDEPFGIVMVEAMACGTPVIGFKRGAVPEVVVQGVNGYYGNTVNELVEYVNQIKNISRTTVFEHYMKNFSSSVIVDDYLKLYYKLISKRNEP